MEDRLERERDFHDKTFGEDTRAAAGKFYSIARSSRRAYTKSILENCRDKRVLEYGCGPGSYAFELARNGAHVVGIDISSVAIGMAREEAERLGLAGFAEFRVMNAEELDFGEGEFDVVCGTGILHHLDLRRSLAELARVLRADGKAVFIEPLGHNPLINFYRRLTPHMRTQDEHPLLRRDLQLLGTYFGQTRVEYFHLLELCAVPLRGTSAFDGVLRTLEAFDQQLFKFQFFRHQAWQVVIELAAPAGSRS